MSQNKTKKDKSSISKKLKVKWKGFLEENLPKLIKFFISYLRRIKGLNYYENPDKLEDFSPIILNDDEDKHCKTIKYAIDNPNIQNLALTGPNGSGKSSILRTFEHKHPEFKCLNISLATFNERTLETEKIEYNILKQLFYSVEPKKIPESRFKRIENHTGIWRKTSFFILWITSISYFLNITYFDELKKALFIYYHYKFLNFVYGFYFIIYSIFLIHKLMNFVINFKLTKFKFKDVDFDSNEDKKTINFENEIDEILYFFEKNPIEIVFIQDIDRFKEKKSEIFIKLREINNLLNNYEPIKRYRKITFIYAVTDDIFKENERSKFFDFIIPVIPIINYTNSSSFIIEKLSDDIEKGRLSKNFIEDVSLFLNDYRTIKSIYNEYIIYKKILGKELLDYNNLFAMMIYKNIEPADFEKLNNNNGYVFKVIENANELIDNKISTYDNKIIELNNRLVEIENEKLKNEKELRMIYVLKFIEMIVSQNNYSVYGFSINDKKIKIGEIILNENFNSFMTQQSIVYYYIQNNIISSGINFSKIEKEINNIKYSQRLKNIEESKSERLDEVKKELNLIEIKKQELNSKKLFELLETLDDNTLVTFFNKHKNETLTINNESLINYLLTNGYINEDYNHYISYFHPGSITKEDNDFLISLLQSEKPLLFTHKLNEIGSLLKKIKNENYNREAILNFSLIDYLVENKIDDKLNLIISLLIKKNEKSINFINEYLNQSNEINKIAFYKIIFNKWNNLLSILLIKSNFPNTKIESYISNVFSILDLTTIEKIDKLNVLSNYISNLNNLNCLNYESINADVLKGFLLKSAVEFKDLKFNEDHKELLDFIYDNILYELNPNMIELFLKMKSEYDINKFETSNYSSILNSNCETLISYVNDNIDEYIEKTFLKLKNNNNESQESLKLLLENENISKEILEELLINGKFIISDLSSIESREIQASLISNNKVDVNWKNIITYYKKEKLIDEVIINYLNIEKNYNILSKPVSINDSDNSVKISFSKDLIKTSISDESFSKLAISLPFLYKNGNEFIEINNSKMKSLIESKKIILSTDNFIMINEEFDNLLIFLIEKNSNEFMKTIEEYELDSSIVLQILNSKVFTPLQQLSVIEYVEDSILIKNKNLLIKLAEFLLTIKINKISSDLLAELISNSVSLKNKVELTNKYFSYIETTNLRKIIVKIGEPYSKLLLGKHPKVDNTSYNQELIKNLTPKLISKPKLTKDNKQIELFPYAIPKI